MVLNLLLFEADGFALDGKDGEEKLHRGTIGAFKRMVDLRECDVVILLNPRVLKPYLVSSHQKSNIFSPTPHLQSSILVGQEI